MHPSDFQKFIDNKSNKIKSLDVQPVGKFRKNPRLMQENRIKLSPEKKRQMSLDAIIQPIKLESTKL